MPQTTLYIRVKQALNWLKRNKGILQKDIAEEMGIAEASFTRALARIKDKNDEDFVILFHSAVNKYISLDYLLTGEGDLTIQTDQALDKMERAIKDVQKTIDGFDSPKQMIDQSSLVNAALAAKDETIASQRETIEALKRENAMLRQQISKYQEKEMLGKYPFEHGVAESRDDKHDTAHV